MLRKKKNCVGKSEEYQYLDLISDILEEGTMEEGRNGLTKSIFGAAMHFSLENGTIPLLTTKRVAWKTCLKELLWFLRGDTIMRICKKKVLQFGMTMHLENF